MTARYRALGPLYIQRLIKPGEEFESSLPPGRNWEPLNSEATAACAERDKVRGVVNAAAAKMDARPPAAGAIEIPDDWQDSHPQKRRALAKRLGAPNTVTAADADGFIQNELERRARPVAA